MDRFFRMMVWSVVAGCVAWLAPAVWAGTSAPGDEDIGIWSQNDLEMALNKSWKIRAGEELRFREHAGLVYFDSHVGAMFKASSNLALGADYVQARQTRTSGKKLLWYWEERPRIYMTPQISIQGFTLENRNLLEVRFKQDTEDTIRYRNALSLQAPWKWTRLEFQPYVTQEIFFESNRNGLAEDRLSVGLKYHLWKALYGSYFYMRQFTKNSQAKWKELNMIGIGLKVVLT